VTATAHQKRRSVLLVFGCTIFGAVAQILIKMGANGLAPNPTVAQVILRILTHLPLFAGYGLYGVSTVLLVLALRHGELSLLYPVIALTFVWVTILSAFVFHESMNPLKLVGIAIIIGGVAILGKGSARTA
jgi:multidrug transporter EmrE-like cation transporter